MSKKKPKKIDSKKPHQTMVKQAPRTTAYVSKISWTLPASGRKTP